MPNTSSFSVRRSVRTGIAILAVALILVPTIKRAQQHVENRDATRLSIKHSWIGVAPPTKATVTPQQAVLPPVPVPEPEPARIALRPPVIADVVLHPVLNLSPDPLRGPPSVSF
jgi:hypothetical protein